MYLRTLLSIALLVGVTGCSLIGPKPVTEAMEAHTVRKFQGETPEIYAVNARKNKLLYAAPNTNPPVLYLYHRSTNTSERINTANVLPGVDKITYADGAFRVWYQGAGLAEIVVERRKKKAAPKIAGEPTGGGTH